MADKKKSKVCYTSIGGQAVIEGVMMRSPTRMAVAVRKPDGKLALSIQPVKPIGEKFKPLGWPIVRGVVNFIMMMAQGMRLITQSAEMSGLGGEDANEPPSRFEKWLDRVTGGHAQDVVMAGAMVVGLAMAIGLFFVLPSLATSLLKPVLGHYVLANLVEGAIRILIFLAYLLLVSRMPDIRRMFQYHGAEHKTIHCYETYGEASVEQARGMSTLHPRCGTSFLLIVMVISILIFSLVGKVDGAIQRVLVRLALLPLVAGVSYEVLKLLALRENVLTHALRWPGMQLQRLTTIEPDDSMLEAAVVAFYGALEGRELPVEPEMTETNGEDQDGAEPDAVAGGALGAAEAACCGGCGSDAQCPVDAVPCGEGTAHADLDASAREAQPAAATII